jgi:glycosyltransferase involved in cell wall biosynthesis
VRGSRLKEVLRRGRSGPAAAGFGHIEHEQDPTDPQRLPEFEMFAVVKTWMDGDVIEATVRNAMVQGASKVFIVDNGSTDDTVARAVAAGAVVAEIYHTESFDGRLVQPLMNATVARESLRSGADHVWWLYLDSDEFPEGPNGMSVREYLASLDRRYRLVGAHYVNHLPAGKPEYLPGFHPIDFQPLCYEFAPARWPPCSRGHWKHPLQRFDRHGHFLLSNDGAHSGFCSEVLLEPGGGVLTHHFQYRDEGLTRAKLELTCGPESQRTSLHGSTGFDGFIRRRRSLDAVYDQRWLDVDTIPNSVSGSDRPLPWPHLGRVRRWYELAHLDAARAAWAAAFGESPSMLPEMPTHPLRGG